MAEYEVIICPVCLTQLHESYEYPTDCYHEEYGSVDGITVKVEPLDLDAHVGLAKFRLADQKRERAFQIAQRRWFENLPEAERDRLEAERRAKLSPFALMMEDMMRESFEQQLESHRQWHSLWERVAPEAAGEKADG